MVIGHEICFMVLGDGMCVSYLDTRYVYNIRTRDSCMVFGHEICVMYLDKRNVYNIRIKDLCMVLGHEMYRIWT